MCNQLTPKQEPINITSKSDMWDAQSYSYKPHTKNHQVTKSNINERPDWKQNTIKPDSYK